MKKRNIKIAVAKHSGFCSGVRRAYDLASVNSKECDDLYILGKLVHNRDVCHDLKNKGIKEIESLENISEGTVIFTAHGVGPGLYNEASERGQKIIDTTCPKVMKAQRVSKSHSEKGREMIIFGDKKHEEVISIFEWSNGKARVIGSLEEVKKIKLNKKKKYCLIAQTTQNVDEFKKIQRHLAKKMPDFIFFNTICDSTDKRQKEIRKLAACNDAVIIIGGKDSANSRRLFEIAKKINPKSYFIENAQELKLQWLVSVKSALIGAGASTPKWVIEKVVDKVKSL